MAHRASLPVATRHRHRCRRVPTRAHAPSAGLPAPGPPCRRHTQPCRCPVAGCHGSPARWDCCTGCWPCLLLARGTGVETGFCRIQPRRPSCDPPVNGKAAPRRLVRCRARALALAVAPVPVAGLGLILGILADVLAQGPAYIRTLLDAPLVIATDI